MSWKYLESRHKLQAFLNSVADCSDQLVAAATLNVLKRLGTTWIEFVAPESVWKLQRTAKCLLCS